MEGTTFGNVPLNIELKMEVWDSPNSAGVVIDALRCCKLALDNGLSGALIEPSAYFKKSPPVQFTDDVARQMVEDFITKYGWKSTPKKQPATRKLTMKKTAATAKPKRTAATTAARKVTVGKAVKATSGKRLVKAKK